jgi:hypothetical protein
VSVRCNQKRNRVRDPIKICLHRDTDGFTKETYIVLSHCRRSFLPPSRLSPPTPNLSLCRVIRPRHSPLPRDGHQRSFLPIWNAPATGNFCPLPSLSAVVYLFVLILESLGFFFGIFDWMSWLHIPLLFGLFCWLLIEWVIAHCLIVDFVPIQIEWFYSVWIN